MLDLDTVLISNLEAGTGTPIFRMKLVRWNGSAWVLLGTYEVTKAYLSRMKYDIFVQEDLLSVVTAIVNSNYAIEIERGLTVAGTDYSIVSNFYYIVDITYSEKDGGSHVVAELLPSMSISNIALDQSNRAVYNAIFSQVNSAYLGWDDTRDIWYDWVPPEETGATFSLVDARQIISISYQHFFSYIFPRWYKSILIYGVASNASNPLDGQYTPFTHARYTKFLWPDKPINLSWDDETTTQTYEPDGQNAAYHSIGRIAAADDPSDDPRFQDWGRVFNGVCYQFVQRPDLNLEQGDLVELSIDGFTETRCLEQFEFFKRGGSPAWVQVVRQLPFHPHLAYIEDWIDWYLTTPSSEGGGVPDDAFNSSPARSNIAANYRNPSARDVEVNAEYFGNVLNLDDSNVENALRSLDQAIITDHGGLGGLTDDDHTQYIRHALATAVSDFLVASGAGAYVKKTLAEVKTLLSLPEDHGTLGGLGDDDHTQYIKHALATAVSDFLVASGSGAFVKKTLAETKTILGITAGGLLSGSSFPGSPASGDTFYRTDLGMLFYYTGSEWRSQEFQFNGGTIYSSTTSGDVQAMRTDMSYYISKVILRTHPASPNNSTNYWTVKIYSNNLQMSAETVHYTFNTKLETDDVFTSREVAPTTASPGANDSHLWIVWSKTASPGVFHISFDIYYYWVAS